jgi:hypothetical protein
LAAVTLVGSVLHKLYRTIQFIRNITKTKKKQGGLKMFQDLDPTRENYGDLNQAYNYLVVGQKFDSFKL